MAIDLLLDKVNSADMCIGFCELLANLFFNVALNSNNENGENFQNALFWLNKAIELDPSNSKLYVELGDLLWIGFLDYSSAEAQYYKAIRLNPKKERLILALQDYTAPLRVI